MAGELVEVRDVTRHEVVDGEHRVAPLEQLAHDPAPDEPGCPGDEDPHDQGPSVSNVAATSSRTASRVIGVT
jgi:hypothetical protein